VKPIVLSVGCPCGIGPEVAVVAAAERSDVVLVGDSVVIDRAASARGIDASRLRVVEVGPMLTDADRVLGAPTAASGAAQLAWIDHACDMVSRQEARALVTGPVSKEAIATSGAKDARGFRGHTEHLAERLRAREVVMAFWTEPLSTSLVTTHVPLRKVHRRLDPKGVARAAFWLAQLLVKTGRAFPRVAVAGLNPHAGEHGLLGEEEIEHVMPGIILARSRAKRAGLVVTFDGPLPAESAFRLAKDGAYDGVVAMYHDQATIPMKLLAFGDAVNVSLGLPIVRTSVDHGTAYDRAARFDADARGMIAAVVLADRLSA
jgi:4-hydroxythreonine-4-phosphate dehydrogenase